MAYNGYYPPTYQAAFAPYQQAYQPTQMPQQQMNQQQQIPNIQQNMQAQQMQIQNGGLVSVRSEDEARNYPVAPGNSVTFKHETEPFVYTKTMGFSQLDHPVFETFRLVKEETQNSPKIDDNKNNIDLSAYAKKEELTAFSDELTAIVERLTALERNSTKKVLVKKKESGDNE